MLKWGSTVKPAASDGIHASLACRPTVTWQHDGKAVQETASMKITRFKHRRKAWPCMIKSAGA